MLLQPLYAEILNKYSLVSQGQFAPFYIKHLTSFDFAEIESISFTYAEEAKDSQIPTVEEKLTELNNDKLWTNEQERSIKDKELFLENLKVTKSKQLAQKIINQFTAEITKVEQEIYKLKIQKQELLGFTTDNYVNKRLSDFCIYKFLFKDAALKEPLFLEYEFDDLTNEEINYLIDIYRTNNNKFESKNLQKISISPFFLNFFYLADDNPVQFYGTNVAYLTLYQSELFSNGIRFKNILNELRGKVDDNILNDPDKLLEYYERGKTASEMMDKINKDGQNMGSTSMVGMKKSDYQAIGIDAEIVDFNAIAKKKGKESLSMADLIEIQERGG